MFGIDAAATGTTLTVPQSIAAHRTWVPGGKLPHNRLFSNTTIRQWTDPQASLMLPGEHWVFSSMAYDPAAFGTWMDGIPADETEVWACFVHEPEDDAKNSGNVAAWIANYLATYAAMDAARKAHPNGAKVKLVKIMMRYQEVDQKQAGCTYKEFHGGQMFVDAFTWDCYRPDWQVNRIPDVATLLQPVVDCAKYTGLPWALTEVGWQALSTDTDGSQRAGFVQGIVDFCRANGALWANFWCSGVWALEGTPAQAVWSAAMSAG